MALNVAEAYRELGLLARSREVNEDVFQRATVDDQMMVRSSAALSLSTLALTTEEEERWVERASPELPQVQLRLLEVRAKRAFSEQRFEDADRLFAEAIEGYREQGEDHAAAANNRALLLGERYTTTGDPAMLESALELLRRSLRIEPDNSVIMSNAAMVEAQRGMVRVLDRWLHVETLRLDEGEAMLLLETLADRPAVEAELARDPALRRSLELIRQEQVLAPRRVGAWGREYGLVTLLGDDDATRDLFARLREVGELDTSVIRERREHVETEEERVRAAASTDAAIADQEATVAAARRRGDRPTLAAALVLLSTMRLDRALERREADEAAAALALLEEADDTWDGFHDGLTSSTLAMLALLRAMEGDPALVEKYKELATEMPVEYSLFVLAERTSSGPAISGREEVARAIRLRSARPDDDLGSRDLALARVTGDDALASRATAAIRQRGTMDVTLDLQERLGPGSPSVEVMRQLWR